MAPSRLSELESTKKKSMRRLPSGTNNHGEMGVALLVRTHDDGGVIVIQVGLRSCVLLRHVSEHDTLTSVRPSLQVV